MTVRITDILYHVCMNQKVLWKIEELWEKAYEPTVQSRVLQKDWQYPTEAFVCTNNFDPTVSQAPVMSDISGEYLGMKQDVVLWRNNKPVYIFDNHHKALFAFQEAQKNFGKQLPLVHIDAHPDDALPEFDIKEITPENLRETYEQSRICDFISVSQQGGLIGEVERIVTSSQFDDYMLPEGPFILSLDIDIFGPEGGYIELEAKVKAIADVWEKAAVVTIATSPGFIDQKFAWEIIKILLGHIENVL